MLNFYLYCTVIGWWLLLLQGTTDSPVAATKAMLQRCLVKESSLRWRWHRGNTTYCLHSALRSSPALCGPMGRPQPSCSSRFPGANRSARHGLPFAPSPPPWGAVTAARSARGARQGAAKPFGRAARSRGVGARWAACSRPSGAPRASQPPPCWGAEFPGGARRRGSVATHWGRREVAAPPASTASRRSRARGTACGRRRWAGPGCRPAAWAALRLHCSASRSPPASLRQGSGFCVFVVSSKPSATLGRVVNKHSLRAGSMKRLPLSTGRDAELGLGLARGSRAAEQPSRPVPPCWQRPLFARGWRARHEHLSAQRPAVPCFPSPPSLQPLSFLPVTRGANGFLSICTYKSLSELRV